MNCLWFLVFLSYLVLSAAQNYPISGHQDGKFYFNGNEWNGLPGYEGPWPQCDRPEGIKREAFVTMLLTDNYLWTTLKWICSLKKVNSQKELLVLYNGVSEQSLRQIQEAGVEVRHVELIWFPNSYASRFSINWTKLRLWSMHEYSRLVYMDSDMFAVQNIDHLFDTPGPFAVPADADRYTDHCSPMGMNQAGLLVLTPCQATFDHMIKMVESNPIVRFESSDAEQGFFNYYFQYNRLLLSPLYNFLVYKYWDTPMRSSAYVYHYTAFKPFQVGGPADIKEYHLPWFSCNITELGIQNEAVEKIEIITIN